jgi:uncharacterized protein YjaG (DUF416 family)
METLRFDEQELVAKLDRLSRPFRPVFAAASAERLVPAYANFSLRTAGKNPSMLATTLENLWPDIQSGCTNQERATEKIELCLQLMPQEDPSSWVSEHALAEDAIAAVTYAFRCWQTGQSQEAAWAARRVYEALDHFVIDQEQVNTNMIGAEDRVLSHPLIQAELSRQQRDLKELLASKQENLSTVAKHMRERAKMESAIVFKV